MNRLRRLLFLGQRLVGDVNAVSRGRLVERAFNRIMGRLVSRAMSKGGWR